MKLTEEQTYGSSKKNERYDLVFPKEAGPQFVKRQVKKRQAEASSWLYLGLIGEIGFTIALPIAGGAFLGSYLDRVWSSYPRATLSLLLVGVFIAVVGFIHAIADIIKRKN